jgi:ADP-ribose pyrophosphatase YjhB (NUDIX family)
MIATQVLAEIPPSGARQPGETPEAAAARELRDEIGLALRLTLVPEAAVSEDVAL